MPVTSDCSQCQVIESMDTVPAAAVMFTNFSLKENLPAGSAEELVVQLIVYAVFASTVSVMFRLV